MNEYLNAYVDFLARHLSLAKPLSIVIDPSNGPAGIVMSALAESCKKSGVKNAPVFTLINDTTDPDFSAHGPNPVAEGAADMISKKVLEIQADFGVMFDADGDRAVIIDNKGDVVPAYVTSLLIFATGQPPYVTDELLFQAIQHGNPLPAEKLIPSRVGARFIKEKIKETGASRGSESSGHYYFNEFFGFDSGEFTAITVANTLSTFAGTLSDFKNTLNPHEMLADNVIFAGENADKNKKDEILKNLFSALDGEFSDRGSEEHRDGTTYDFGDSWLNIRTSNTEPLLRLTAGAPTKEDAQALIDRARKVVGV